MMADIIVKGNTIFDGTQESPFAGFVAIKGDRIIKVATSEVEIKSYLDEKTKVIECYDKLIMPGFHDSHTHLILAALYKTNANFINARSEQECVEILYESTKDSPEDEWGLGFSWYHVFWKDQALPTKESLDEFFPNKPVFLLNAEGHGAWVNSKALEIAGVDKSTPDPEGGYFARDESGDPTGFLYESAIGSVSKFAYEFSEEQEKELIREYLEDAKVRGITSVNDMKPYFHGNIGNAEILADMESKGELTCRVNVAMDLFGDLDEAERLRENIKTDMVRVNLLKQFLDGVCTTHTALMVEEYSDMPGNYGIALCDLDLARKRVLEAHKRGFCIRLHSCGDKSAKLSLDFFEDAIEKYGKGNNRHGIEHLEIVKEEDILRFSKLGVIPSVQPEHLALTQTFTANPYPVVLGEERGNKTWPFKDLYDQAGLLAFGSDCPVVDNNPFLEIYRAITRLHNDKKPEGGWNPGQKLNLYQTLRSYTYGSAYGVCREDELGTLEKGKYADIIVIDRNLFEVDDESIFNAQVELTMVGGKVVFNDLTS